MHENPIATTTVVSAHAEEAVERFLNAAVDPARFGELMANIQTDFQVHGVHLIAAFEKAMNGGTGDRRTIAAWFLAVSEEQYPSDVQDRHLGERARQVLQDVLERGSEDDQIMCCLLLAGSAAPQITEPALRQLLTCSNDGIQILAAAALATLNVGDSAIIQILRRGLRAGHPVAVACAARAMAQLGLVSAQPVEELIACLDRADAECLIMIVHAFKGLGSKASLAFTPLCKVIGDERMPSELRRLALGVVGEISSGSDFGAVVLLDAMDSGDSEIVKGGIDGFAATGYYPPPAIDRLAKLLAAEDIDIRLAAAMAFAFMGPEVVTATAILVDRIGQEPDLHVVEGIAGALANIGKPALLQLIGVLRQSDMRKMPAIVLAISWMGNDGAVALAEGLRTEHNEFVRSAFISILREMGAAALPSAGILARMLEETANLELALSLIAAIEAIGVGATVAIPGLIHWLATNNEELAARAARTLHAMYPEARSSIDAALGRATGIQRQRLEKLVAWSAVWTESKFKEYEAIGDDAMLQRFVYIAELLMQKPMSTKDMAKVFKARMTPAAIDPIPPDSSLSARNISLTIESLEDLWKHPLTTRAARKAGGLTEKGKVRLVQVKEYLEHKQRLLM